MHLLYLKQLRKFFEMMDNIVTDNAANYKAAGQMLMTKRKKVILDTLCCTLYGFNVGGL